MSGHLALTRRASPAPHRIPPAVDGDGLPAPVHERLPHVRDLRRPHPGRPPRTRDPAPPARPRDRARRHRRRPADDRARRHHRQHRAAAHPDRPRLQQRQPVLGRQRLRPRPRQPAAARRPARRPARPPPDVHHRCPALRRRVPRRWPGRQRGHAHRLPDRPGRRRRDRLTRRPRPHHHDLPGRQGTQPRHGRVRGDVRCRCGRRPHPRRRPDRVRLALDLLHQRADRPARRDPRSAGARRERAVGGQLRPRRRRSPAPPVSSASSTA